MNKYLSYFCLLLIVSLFGACSKSDTVQGSDAYISTSISNDSLSFDTVFTSRGSITKKIMLYNINKQKLQFSDIRLEGGTASAYQINVNGRSGTDFTDVELEAGDSLYLFVKVNIDPTDASSPFVVRDSIAVQFNGNTRYLKLQAYGQNATYLTTRTITQDTVWPGQLPIVLLGDITVAEGAALHIQKGARVYVHGQSALTVNGTLDAQGDTATKDRISFLTDRLDYDYKNLAGAWTGITFGANSKSNQLNYVTIRNARYAIADTLNTATPTSSKLTLVGCMLQNNSGYGLLGRLTNWSVTNSLIANNGQGVGLYDGGNYSFVYNTIVGYSNAYVSHSLPCVYFSGNVASWNTSFTNCIIYGENTSIADEVSFATGFSLGNGNVHFTNSLLKYASLPSSVTLSQVIANSDPSFVEVNNDRAVYDFHLSNTSPAFGTGTSVSTINYDLEGAVRNSLNPFIGCYESR